MEKYRTYQLNRIVFLPIPAFNKKVNEKRYKKFCELLCEDLKIENGYSYISMKENNSTNHLKNDVKAKKYGFILNEDKLKGKHLIIFDDILTSGKTFYSLVIDALHYHVRNEGEIVKEIEIISQLQIYFEERI